MPQLVPLTMRSLDRLPRQQVANAFRGMKLELVARRIPIQLSLKPSLIDEQSCNLGRYHLVRDLAHQGPDQIALFLARASALLQAFISSHHGLRCGMSHSTLQKCLSRLELLTVVAHSVIDDIKIASLPLFDFISIASAEGSKAIPSVYGVMLSTYLHDLDRSLIASPIPLAQEHFIASRALVDALFYPSPFTLGRPPLDCQFPLLIFPGLRDGFCQPPTVSRSNAYMSHLGFDVVHMKGINDVPLRLYSHRQDLGCQWQQYAPLLLAIGQTCVEMVRPDLRSAQSACEPGLIRGVNTDNCLPKPFNRQAFGADVQLRQQQTIEDWMAMHLDVLRLIPTA